MECRWACAFCSCADCALIAKVSCRAVSLRILAFVPSSFMLLEFEAQWYVLRFSSLRRNFLSRKKTSSNHRTKLTWTNWILIRGHEWCFYSRIRTSGGGNLVGSLIHEHAPNLFLWGDASARQIQIDSPPFSYFLPGWYTTCICWTQQVIRELADRSVT